MECAYASVLASPVNESKTDTYFTKSLAKCLVIRYSEDMYLAIDIGGTKTLVALFTDWGKIVKRFKFKTPRGSKRFVDELTMVLKNGFVRKSVKVVVVTIPGVVQKNYTVKFGNRDWPDLDLITPLKELFTCPIYFENDANLATLYEGSFYKGKTVFLTFSTGIGGGVVENGELLPESAKFEPGHKIYEYNGKKAEWEDIAAASALEKFYHVDMATDLRKKEVMEDVAKRMWLGLEDVILKYQPKTIVLGGPMGKIFRRYAKFIPTSKGVKYVRPRRPLESPVYGCYFYAKTHDPKETKTKTKGGKKQKKEA